MSFTSLPRFLCANCVTLTQRKCLHRIWVQLPQGCFGTQTCPPFHCFIVFVSLPCSWYPKAKAIQSRVHKQNNCPSFGTKSTSSCIAMEQTWLVSIYMVSIKHVLWTADCELQTTDYGLDIKHRLMYNVTQYVYKWEQTLSYACALQSIHLFLPLLKGDQFHPYLTAQAQNAFPRIFVFFNIPSLPKIEHTL